MVFFPLVMLTLSESILKLQGPNPALANSLKIIRNLILPTLVVFLALTQILGVDQDSEPIRLLQSLLLLSTIHLSLALVNLFFFVEALEGTWQARVPKLLRDLVRFFLILVGTAVVLSIVWKLDLGNLITALGVSSIVIGLALQDTLGNLFSGIALLVGRPLRIGDWIKINDTVGKVNEINWRAVHLTTRDQEQLIVPNSVLAKEIFTNFNQPTRLHVETVEVGFSYADPPNQVKRVLVETALATQGVLDRPKPEVQTINYNDSSIDYRVRLFLADYSKVPKIRDEFMTRIWYAAQRHQLEIPFPIRTVLHQPLVPQPKADHLQALLENLQSIPLFSTLDQDSLQDLVQGATHKTYGENEPILEIGDRNVQLHLILSGQVRLFLKETTGREQTVAQLERGDLFGTMALLSNEPSVNGAKATSDSEVLVFETKVIHIMLARSPKFAQLLGEILENRRRDVNFVLSSPQST